ncbi:MULTISPECIES: glycoside hydrolase family 125 protein [unclassified Mucilaginibacter]|uniref:glycoside hydrolase family 125 protein n=1 Tax=unclassified Mucilaginibacter TaxID=2617802 RepID=UPI0009619BFA|nr:MULTISPECIES: glycoside hydrolase family 125 protein [unclassified Mucilaginibacter]OJW18422.1 MAG: metal-independent alpha-mannosidase [Mucilaginibacter sp. 44-25]PLW89352.1 MAG: metal-independent alpha-mannosidase [Mucilaginibacter sp.]PMP64661.1 MAG: metal-independent alpha-mannosidase [Mucilaginibacter sp.]HEK20194.1 glycoside hydrolase family 125 protein [Bacteroidota bacterium]
MKRRQFIGSTTLLGAGVFLNKISLAAPNTAFPIVRVAPAQRRFKSTSVEKAITEFKSKVKNPELGWLFENCFPNTLDTTVTYKLIDGRPDTYVITGDIDAMWLRDSSAQVWPYIAFINKDAELKKLVAGVINRQVTCILRDPYANAFYDDPNKVGEWKDDVTDMKPGLHERKWEIDSLCYPIRLAYKYWKLTGDTAPFDARWKSAIQSVLKTFRDQQRKENDGPYSFQRKTSWATDGVPMNGFGYPVKPVGLICSAFRPSDDATIYSFLIPSNFFAVISLKQAAEMVTAITKDTALAAQLTALAAEVDAALQKHAVIDHPDYGKIYAYEVNGFGSFNLMDDANVPSLLGLPYLDAVKNTDPVYLNTRKMLLSLNNPFFFKGTAGEGIGGPHIGKDMIWPISIIIRALTSNNDAEIKECIEMLRKTHGSTGFMHESFHKNDPTKFTRKWFAWANTLFGELLWETYTQKPQLLA